MNTSYEALERYGLDLVAQARAGRLDPVIGRDEEIRRTIRILSRKTKNNPVLIGEPGVGKTEGSTDAGNMLKPMLARGELHCIGATTLDEHRRHIEKDAALERRFQPVLIDAPTVEDSISILRGLRERFEVHHGVRIQDNALVDAAVLSNRYISDRFLPDKAIDLIDEACATVRTEIDSVPAELDQVERRVMQLEIEEAALKKEHDKTSEERLESLRKELADLKVQAGALRAQWEEERASLVDERALREEIEQVRHQIEEAERQYDLNRAAELKHGKLPELERQLAAAQQATEGDGLRLLREEVTQEEVAEIVSRWTGIPLQRLTEFLNRIDDVVLFKPLTLAEIEEIVELLIDELRQRLAAKRIELVVATPARRHIAHAGFDPVYGARPLKRFLQRELETRIARLLVAGDMPEGSRVEVVLDEGQLAVRHQPLEVGTES